MNVQALLALAPKRNIGQAAGFYFGYLVIAMTIALIIGLIAGWTAPDTFVAAERGSVIGLIVAIVFSCLLTVLVIWRKGLYHSRRDQIIAAAAVLAALGLASFTWGIILGLVPAAILTMRAAATPTLYADESPTPQAPTQAI